MFWDRLRSFWEKDERWSLSCDYHNWTVHDLSWREARAILETLRDVEKSSLLVWRTGWPAWRSLRDGDCAILLNTRIVKLQAPPLPSDDQTFDPEITAVRPVSTTSPFISRQHERFNIVFPVTVAVGDHEFKTETVDLSEGGMKLRDALPDWVAGYCSVILEIEDGRRIQVLCSLAEDQKQAKSRLEIVVSETGPEFYDWFRSHPRFKGEA